MGAERRAVEPGKGLRREAFVEVRKVGLRSMEWKDILARYEPVCVKRLARPEKLEAWDDAFLAKVARGSKFKAYRTQSNGLCYAYRNQHAVAAAAFGAEWGGRHEAYVLPPELTCLNRMNRADEARDAAPLWYGLPQNRPADPATPPRYMLEELLHSGLGPSLAEAFARLPLDSVNEIRKCALYGQPSGHFLQIIPAGTARACHYDEEDTVLVQVGGVREVVIFHPDAYPTLYAYPVHHPADRYSQVAEHIERGTSPGAAFPRFPFAGLYAQRLVLHPGDTLYLPAYWWLHEHAPREQCVSLKMWCRTGPNDRSAAAGIEKRRLAAPAEVAMRRDLEKALVEEYGAAVAMKLWVCLERGRIPPGEDCEPIVKALDDMQRILHRQLPPMRASNFIKENVDGRFAHLDFKMKVMSEFLAKFDEPAPEVKLEDCGVPVDGARGRCPEPLPPRKRPHSPSLADG